MAGPTNSDHRVKNIRKTLVEQQHIFQHHSCSSLCTFDIKVTKNYIYSQIGILGGISVYYSVIEVQGHGTLYVYMLLWLVHISINEIQELLKAEEFQDYV
jgi:hypothetical protein